MFKETDIYDFYQRRCARRKQKYELMAAKCNDRIRDYKRDLKENADFIETYSNMVIGDCLQTPEGVLYQIVWKNPLNTETLRKRIMVVLKNYAKMLKTKADYTYKVKIFAEGLSVSKEIFVYSIRKMNYKISEAMIEDAYELTVGWNLSKILIQRKIRKRPRVDWNLSNAKRAKLIEEGKVPYNRDEAPDGENWLIYHEGMYDTMITWIKKMATATNAMFYGFSPPCGPNGFANRVQRRVKENPDMGVMYAKNYK